MSVIMTLTLSADPAKLEELAGANPDRMRGISEQAKEHGLIAHRFYGSDEGKVMVVDEWPDPESFEKFFQSQQGEIGALMQEAGVSDQPQPKFWRKLETHDEVGWEGV